MARFTLAAVLVVLFHVSSSCAKPVNDVTMPAKCGDANFCTSWPEDYPKDTIEKLLEGTHDLFDEAPETVHQRSGDEDSQDECASTAHTLPIYQIKDNANRTRFVVQSEKKFKQIIRIEQCNEPGIVRGETRSFNSITVEAARLTCVQCTLNYKFLVLSLDGKSLETVDVKGGLPVCCACRSLKDN